MPSRKRKNKPYGRLLWFCLSGTESESSLMNIRLNFVLISFTIFHLKPNTSEKVSFQNFCRYLLTKYIIRKLNPYVNPFRVFQHLKIRFFIAIDWKNTFKLPNSKVLIEILRTRMWMTSQSF